RRARIAILEVLEDQRRVVEREVAIDQARHLGLRIDGDDVRMMRQVAVALAPADLDALVRQRLLGERDADLGGEEAERPRVELHPVDPPAPCRQQAGCRRRTPESWAPTI